MSYPSISPVGLSQPLPTILPKASPTGVINPIRAISGNDPDRMRAIATKYREALDNPFIDSATRARLQGAFGLQPDPPTGGGSAQAGPMPQTGGPAFPKPGGSFPKPGPMGPGGSFMPP